MLRAIAMRPRHLSLRPSARWFGPCAALAIACTSGIDAVKTSSDLGRDDAHGEEGSAAFDDARTTRGSARAVASYTLRATLDPVAHTIHGEGTIRWTNASNVAKDDVWLHLYLNAFKNQKSAFLREPVGRARGVSSVRDWGTIDVRKFSWREGPAPDKNLWDDAELRRPGDEDETDVHVPLPRPIEPGETVTFDVVFDDKLPSVVERTGYDGTFHFAGQWFPKIARLEDDGTWAHFPFHHLAEFYADFGEYDVTIDVPEAFRIGATGPVVESSVAGGRRVERHVQGDVHDFAFTAWDRWETQSETIDGVAVTALHPPGYARAAERELAAMRFAIPHFTARYGPYPYSVLTLVHPPETAGEAGGMEYPTLITTGGSWRDPAGVRLIELVTIHEFGHQYFYGLLASNEMAWPFLDEGLNSFAEQSALDAWLGPGNVIDLFGLTVSDATVQAINGNTAVHDQPVAIPAHTFATGSQYGALVYSRTASVLETLRRVYGAEKFDATLRAYTSAWRFLHPRPEDLLQAFREGLGRPAAENLRKALFDEGWVDYVVAGVSSRPVPVAAGLFDRDGKRETVTEGQKGATYEGSALVLRRGTLKLPVVIELTREDGTKERVPWDGDGDFLRVPYAGTSPLRYAEVDPDRLVLIDPDRTNNHASAGDARAFPARTVERATYFFELAMQLLSP